MSAEELDFTIGEDVVTPLTYGDAQRLAGIALASSDPADAVRSALILVDVVSRLEARIDVAAEMGRLMADIREFLTEAADYFDGRLDVDEPVPGRKVMNTEGHLYMQAQGLLATVATLDVPAVEFLR